MDLLAINQKLRYKKRNKEQKGTFKTDLLNYRCELESQVQARHER